MSNMNSTYRMQIKSVMDFLRSCKAETVLKSIRRGEFNVESILTFYDSYPELVARNHEDQQDKLVHEEFVELALHFSFKTLRDFSKPMLDSIQSLLGEWKQFKINIQTNGVENSCLDIIMYDKTTSEHLNWINWHLPFLPDYYPDDDYPERSGNIIRLYFSEWYCIFRSIRLIVLEEQREVQLIKLSIPTSKFNQRYPVNPLVLQSGEFGLSVQLLVCDLCLEGCVCRAVCSICKDKTVCYNCWRKIAWGQQHNEYQVFTQLRSVYCPFCKSIMDDTVSPANIQLNHAPAASSQSTFVQILPLEGQSSSKRQKTVHSINNQQIINSYP